MGKPKSRKSNVASADKLLKSEPIAADPNLVATDFEGLVSFEEITDYNVTSLQEFKQEPNLKQLKELKKKKKIKRLQPEHKKKLSKNDNKVAKGSTESNSKVIEKVDTQSSKTCSKVKKKKNAVTNSKAKNSVNQNVIHNKQRNIQSQDGEEVKKVFGVKDGLPPEGMEAWAHMGIGEPLLKALQLKKFTTPTQVQALCIPPAILGRRDILGAAETGSGKTLAFGLPILQGILIQKELSRKSGSKAVAKDGNNDNLGSEKNDETEIVLEGNVLSENEESADESDNEIEDDGDDQNNVGHIEQEDCELVEGDFDEETSDGDENAEDLGCVKVVPKAIFNMNNDKKYRPKPLYALILTPTRELAVQVKKHITDAAALTDIKVALVVGGLSSQKQERLLNYGPEIVVGTPGRLWELVQQRHPHFANIENIRFLAIDETDRMLEKGHFEELTQLLTLMNENKPQGVRRQNFLFSATLTLVHAPPSYIKRMKKKGKDAQLTPEGKLKNIVKQMGLQNPKVVDITQPNCVPETLKEARIICSSEDKDFYLYYFLKLHPGRTLVFCNSIGCVQRLHSLFTLLECSPYPLHSNLQQRQRLKNLERFTQNPKSILVATDVAARGLDVPNVEHVIHYQVPRTAEVSSRAGYCYCWKPVLLTQNPKSILVATDVAARGLDVPNVEHVIHYQVPRTAESYIHRSGRTARASEDGLTVLLMDGSEVRTYTKIFSTLKRDPILPDFPVENKYLIKVKDRVKLARQLDTLELKAKRLSSEESWVKKAVNEMDIELSDDELPIRSSKGEVDDAKRKAANIRKRLQVLTKQPLFDPVKQLSRKAFITSGINSDGSYAGMQGPKPSAVKALEAAVEERKERKKKRKLERNKRKQSLVTSNGTAAKTHEQANNDASPDPEDNEDQNSEVGEPVEYPDFSMKKKRKNK